MSDLGSMPDSRVYNASRGLPVTMAAVFLVGGAIWLEQLGPWLKVVDLATATLIMLFPTIAAIVGSWKLMNLVWGLPQLAVTSDGIELKTLFGVERANWSSLGVFDVIGDRHREAEADLVGENESKSSLSRKTFTIPDAFSTQLDELVRELNAARAQALGLSAEPAAEDVQDPDRLGATLVVAAVLFAMTILAFAVLHHDHLFGL